MNSSGWNIFSRQLKSSHSEVDKFPFIALCLGRGTTRFTLQTLSRCPEQLSGTDKTRTYFLCFLSIA